MFPHLPLTCKEFSLFLSNSKIHGLLDENWILHKTKKCPNCQTDIEKNAGCNHMSCKMCSHEFCWLCLKNWNGHVSTKCSKEQKEIFPKVEEQKKESNEKIKFFQEIIRLREDFVRNKEKTVEVKHKLLQNYNYHSKILESKLRKEEFRDYLMFVTELESFIFLGENYSAFIDVNILEKKRIIDKIREIRQKLISLNFSFRYLKNTVSFADIYKSFNGIKTSSFSQNIFQQIKPLMNDILKITKDRNYNVKKQLLC